MVTYICLHLHLHLHLRTTILILTYRSTSAIPPKPIKYPKGSGLMGNIHEALWGFKNLNVERTYASTLGSEIRSWLLQCCVVPVILAVRSSLREAVIIWGAMCSLLLLIEFLSKRSGASAGSTALALITSLYGALRLVAASSNSTVLQRFLIGGERCHVEYYLQSLESCTIYPHRPGRVCP